MHPPPLPPSPAEEGPDHVAPPNLITELNSLRESRQKVQDQIVSLKQQLGDVRVMEGTDPEQNRPSSAIGDSNGSVGLLENVVDEKQIAVETRLYSLCFDAEQLKVEEEDLLNEMRDVERERILGEDAEASSACAESDTKTLDGFHDTSESLEEAEEEGIGEGESLVMDVMDLEGQARAMGNLESLEEDQVQAMSMEKFERPERKQEQEGQGMVTADLRSKEKDEMLLKEDEEETPKAPVSLEEEEEETQRGDVSLEKEEEEEIKRGQVSLGEEQTQRGQINLVEEKCGGQGEIQIGQVSIEEEQQQRIGQVSIEEEQQQQRGQDSLEDEEGNQVCRAMTMVGSEHHTYDSLRSTGESTFNVNGDHLEDVQENDERVDQEHHMHELENRISELFEQKARLETANADLHNAVLKLRCGVQNEEETQRLIRIKEDIKKLEGFLEEAKEKAMALANKEKGLKTKIQELSVIADGSKRRGVGFPSPLVISGSTIVIVGLLVLFWHSRSRSG